MTAVRSTTVGALARSCHAAPCIAVTVLVAAYAATLDAPVSRVALVTAAVLTGQLVIGWTNDIIDRGRDRAVGRPDKPLATGDITVRTVGVTAAVSFGASVVLSLLCGVAAGLVHIVLGLGFAMAYNLGMKSTVLSWLPYTVAFGAVPVVVGLAVVDEIPPWWIIGVGALLGFGAHLVNVLPDLADDDATGVRGFPHRLPPAAVAPLAAAALVAGTVLAIAGSGVLLSWWGSAAVGTALALAVAVVTGRGRVPFHSCIAIAAVTVGALLFA